LLALAGTGLLHWQRCPTVDARTYILARCGSRAVVSYPCGIEGHALLASELRSLHLQPCAHRRPSGAALSGQLLRACCTQGSGWQNRVYPASARTPPRIQCRFLLGKPFAVHDTTLITLWRSGRCGTRARTLASTLN